MLICPVEDVNKRLLGLNEKVSSIDATLLVGRNNDKVW